MEKRIEALTADQRAPSPRAIPGGSSLAVEGDLSAGRTGRSTDVLPSNGVPEVSADRRFPLGKYRGLTFGIEYRWNNAHIYLTGLQLELSVPLSKEARGARSRTTNALNRISTSLLTTKRLEANTKELDLARSQLRDYEAQLGRPLHPLGLPGRVDGELTRPAEGGGAVRHPRRG